MSRFRVQCLALACLALVGMEGAARLVFDFPLFAADAEVGYWLLPSQRGTFLLTNDWVFNDDSLGVAEEFRASDKLDLLLVGDSIVYGGNSLRQAAKLGPLLEAHTGWQVWPAASPSWALQNELAFLARKPELVEGADAVVFVLTRTDFAEPSAWQSQFTHPRKRPTLFLPYLFRRYVLTPTAPPPPMPVPQRDVLADWLEFTRQAEKPVIVIAYTDRPATGQNCAWVPAAFTRAGNWSCFDPVQELGADALRDDIHPTPRGFQALIQHIQAVVRDELPAKAGDIQ